MATKAKITKIKGILAVKMAVNILWEIFHKTFPDLPKGKTKRELAGALKYLIKEYVCVMLKKSNKTYFLCVQTEPMLIEDWVGEPSIASAIIQLDLAKIIARLPEKLDRYLSEHGIKIYDSNWHRFRRRHVYLNDSHLCVGDGYGPLYYCLKDSPPRIDDAIDIIYRILKTKDTE